MEIKALNLVDEMLEKAKVYNLESEVFALFLKSYASNPNRGVAFAISVALYDWDVI